METIGQSELWSFFDEKNKIRKVTNDQVRKASGHEVRSYMELATKVAELQFENWNHVLLFRGQNSDFKNLDDNTSLKPTLFRGDPKRLKGQTWETLFRERFEKLRKAEKELIDHFSLSGKGSAKYLRKYRILRWALLQHYDVCDTPLLDVTHSLRIASSFASIRAVERAYIFVLGVPNLSGAITASAEGGLQIVRLASVCPPTAVRPHIQEGYLLGEYPETAGLDQKRRIESHEIDFGRRLIAKFWFNPLTFWKKDSFSMVTEGDLYPNKLDPIFKLAEAVKKSI